MFTQLHSYIRHTAGATALVFALTIPVVLGSVGMAVDLSFGYLIKQRLSHALDAAAVAAAASEVEGEDLTAKVNQFIDQNYPDDSIGKVHDVKVVPNGNDLYVSASASYDTMFATFLGIKQFEVSTSTTVTRNIVGLEVVLVLDVTGSMDSAYYDDQQRRYIKNIETLRTASTNFVNLLFSSSIYDDTVKIGMVPYSTTVNVGPYGLGLDLDGDPYDTAFVHNEEGFSYYNPQAPEYNPQANVSENSSSYKNQWRGCILEHDYSEDTEDSTDGWTWEPYRHTYRYAQNNYYRQLSSRCKSTDRWGRCTGYYYNWEWSDLQGSRNENCPKAHIVPLTSDKDALNYEIAKLKADGNTSGNIGMVWGYRVISPEFPFKEGVAFDDPKWRKAVVMMTDGDNTVNNIYTPYGGYTQSSVRSVTTMNDRFAETCQNMKDDGILIYTVTFTSGISDNTKDYYRECASDESKYYDAPSQTDLLNAFNAISKELSNIYIKN
ncbi:MAG: pilus assembly protein TadG-related protein [Pseudobdellovibrionaceae bacterium]